MSAPGSGQEAFRRVRRPTVLAFSRRLRLLKKFMVLLLDGGWLMFGAASTTPVVLSEKPSETRTQEGTDVAPKICRTSFFHPQPTTAAPTPVCQERKFLPAASLCAVWRRSGDKAPEEPRRDRVIATIRSRKSLFGCLLFPVGYSSDKTGWTKPLRGRDQAASPISRLTSGFPPSFNADRIR